MILLDTHVWLWWNDDPGLLSAPARRALEAADRLGVSVMSCIELARLAEEDRIDLSMDAAGWIRRALAIDPIELVGLDADTAVAAARLDRRRFPGDPADRLIYASAVARGARLATKDRRIRAFDPESTVW